MDTSADSDRVSLARIAGSGMNRVLLLAAVNMRNELSDEAENRVAFGRTHNVVNIHWCYCR